MIAQPKDFDAKSGVIMPYKLELDSLMTMQ